MEDTFYRHKTQNHQQRNMTKAALNMMTRTSAAELAEMHNIYMTAVDTGWINDENPRQIAARTADVHDFQTTIDEVDAAARVPHPVFHGSIPGNEPLRGIVLERLRRNGVLRVSFIIISFLSSLTKINKSPDCDLYIRNSPSTNVVSF
jgi:NAD(P)-dependent dehydrogenase (short-subunit alcohol dehydrogenase family)